MGRKHEPVFRLVVTESTNSTKSGKFLEVIGSYDPRRDQPQFNAERIKEWMSKGAKVTDTVHNLLITQKIISGKKINVLPKKTVPKAAEPAATQAEPIVATEAASGAEVVKEESEAEQPKVA